MVGIGSATRYGISHAKEEKTDTTSPVGTECTHSLPFVLGGLFYLEEILRLLGADAGLTELGRPYLRIILIGCSVLYEQLQLHRFCQK